MSDYMTVDEVASILRVSKMTVYRLIHSGQIVSVRVGHLFRVPRSALEEYIEETARMWRGEADAEHH